MASEKPLAEQRSISIGLLEKRAEGSDSSLNMAWGDLTKPVLTFDGRLSSTPILADAFQFLNELPDSKGSTISSLADEYASDDEKYEAVEVALQSAEPIPVPFFRMHLKLKLDAFTSPARFNARYPFRALGH